MSAWAVKTTLVSIAPEVVAHPGVQGVKWRIGRLKFEGGIELSLAAGSLEEHDEMACDRQCHVAVGILLDER